MLLELVIRNYTLIDSLSVSFDQGLTIITGETGAGKSIIVGAIGFLLGAKADAGVIRAGCEEASVSAVLRLPERPPAEFAAWLAERDIAPEDSGALPESGISAGISAGNSGGLSGGLSGGISGGLSGGGELIIRRTLRRNGRGSIFIQNVPVNRSDLETCMGFLFDIHGQHAHESLLRPVNHRKYLDRFGALEAEALAFNELFRELQEKRKCAESAVTSEKERERRRDILCYIIDEIDKAALKPGETRSLEAESSRLASFEKLAWHIGAACESFCDSGASALPLVRKTQNAASAAAALDSELSALANRVSDLFYEADDIAQELKNYRANLSFEPERLEQVEERLAFINKLKKKYGQEAGAAQDGEAAFSSVEDAILSRKTEAETELGVLSRTEESRDALLKEIAALEMTIAAKARALTAKRAAVSGDLSRRISVILSRLGMPAARFSVRLEAKGGAAGGNGAAGAATGTGAAGAATGTGAAGGGTPGTGAATGGGTPGTGAAGGGNFVIGPYGADDVEFLFTANLGEGERELARIASGGELSRVMLAIKTALTDAAAGGGTPGAAGGGTPGAATGGGAAGGGTATGGGAAGGGAATGASDGAADTLIFDEIDTGIGGEVAIAVGDYLAQIGKAKQIFCITHLAVIASKAHNHLKVEKEEQNGRTITRMRRLSSGERREEIARMLSGDVSEAALAHADELLERRATR